MPENTLVSAETSAETLESKLTAILDGEQSPTAPDGKPATPAEPSPAEGEAAPSQTPPGQPETSDLDKKLEAIEEAKEPEKPTLSAEQERILKIIPNAEVAQQLNEVVESWQGFQQTFLSGNFSQVEKDFADWNPKAYDAFKEYIYQKHVANGDWVDRWIADKEGNPTVNHGMKRLEGQIEALQKQLEQRQSRESESATQAQIEAMAGRYVSHVDGLFDKIEFSKADRRWVAADINARAAADPEISRRLRSGDMNAVNGVFKAAVRDYVTRDKAAAESKQAALDKQAEKKVVVPTGTPIETAAGEPEIGNFAGVPREQHESLMDRMLQKLAKTAKRR